MNHGATEPRTDTGSPQGWLDRIAFLLVVLGIFGVVAVGRIGRPGMLNPGTGTNTFFEQYRLHEPMFLAIMALFAVATAVLARRGVPDETGADTSWAAAPWSGVRLVALAASVFAITALGTWAVMHAFPLSMDEYAAAFQARAFAEGRVAVALPETLRQFGPALKPVFVVYDAETNSWLSAYWPGYGLLRALFLRIEADQLLNPLLAAASVPLVYLCALRLWPGDRARAWMAVGFLVLSSQFLFMSMTGYAMPAHLVISLLWLYAYARADRAGWIAAPIIGVIALGLHNPVPHALFVAPFLVHLVLSRRWGWTAYFGAAYLSGIAIWGIWAQTVTAASADGGSLLGLFSAPGLLMLSVQEMSLTVMLSWQTPILAVLLLWLAFAWRSLSAIELCLASSVLLAFVFFLFYPSTQGHGWGYRYTYPMLGNLALLGTSGLARMRQALGATLTRRLLVASALVTVAVQVPVRAWQIERYVRPFADVHDYVAAIDADVVIVDPTSSWYGIDLVRNDPFLRSSPKVMSAFYLRPDERRALAEQFGNRVHLLQPNEVGQFGIPLFPSRFKKPIWPPL